MARLRRSQLEDGFFHVTARGVDEMHIFRDDLDRIDFLHLIADASKRFKWRRDAYCLLGTHYHLLVESKRKDLSEGMQHLNSRYAQRFNKRHRRRGHVFEARFS